MENLNLNLLKTTILNKNEIIFINNLVNSNPSVFEDLSTILKNGKIDAKDIPNFIFTSYKIIKANISSNDIQVNIINILEFLFDTAISNISDYNNLILFKNIGDICFNLLKENIGSIEHNETICCNWVKMHF